MLSLTTHIYPVVELLYSLRFYMFNVRNHLCHFLRCLRNFQSPVPNALKLFTDPKKTENHALPSLHLRHVNHGEAIDVKGISH